MEKMQVETPILALYIHYPVTPSCPVNGTETTEPHPQNEQSHGFGVLRLRYQNGHYELLSQEAVIPLINSKHFMLENLSITAHIEEMQPEVIETISFSYEQRTQSIPILDQLRKLAPIATDHLTSNALEPDDPLAFLERPIEKPASHLFVIEEPSHPKKTTTILNTYFKPPNAISDVDTSSLFFEHEEYTKKKEANILHDLGFA